MADGVTMNIKNVETIKAKMAKMLSLTQNFMPLFNILVGDKTDPKSWTIRGGIKYNMDNQRGPNDETWPALSPTYAVYKKKTVGDLPMLQFSGRLYDSLIGAQHNEGDTVQIMTGKKLWFGTTVPYAAVHQTGESPKWNSIFSRPYVGLRKGQSQRLQLEIRNYILAAYKAGGS